MKCNHIITNVRGRKDTGKTINIKMPKYIMDKLPTYFFISIIITEVIEREKGGSIS